MRKGAEGTAPAWRMYPHIIMQGDACNRRHDLHITNEPLPDNRIHWHAAYAFSRPGSVDADNRVTPVGRAVILETLRGAMHPRDEMCVVWGPRECTYVTSRGTIDSDDPPIGQPQDTAAITRLPALDYEGAVIRLPAGCDASHLFIRRLAHDRVEVATAAPMTLYDATEPVRPGERDPVAGCRSAGGGFIAPRRLMGVATSGADEGLVLGPVQPDGAGIRIVTAWPTLVTEACIELAGRPLDASTTASAWRAAERLPRPIVRCGTRTDH